MTSQRDTLKAFTDAAADAVAREIAALRVQADQTRQQFADEHASRLQALDAALAAVSDLQRELEERIASVKAADVAEIERLVNVTVAALPPAPPGKDVDLAELAERIAAEVERVLAGWEKPKDGITPSEAEVQQRVDVAVERAVGALPPAKDGAPGKLPVVAEWEDRVYYQGDVVTRDGSTFQANKDTGRAPPHEDWTCIARGGRDGRSPRVRDTWTADGEYERLDVVALNGAAFIARQDNPGQCPGDGWQMIAAQGKRGKPGERGDKGPPARALPAPTETVIGMTVTEDGLLKLANSDGSVVECDLYPVLSRLRQ